MNLTKKRLDSGSPGTTSFCAPPHFALSDTGRASRAFAIGSPTKVHDQRQVVRRRASLTTLDDVGRGNRDSVAVKSLVE